MVAPRIELSTTRVSGGFGQPALDYLVLSRTPESRTQNLLLPKQACYHLHLYPMCWLRRFRRRISSLSVGREALESSSAVLQTAARPSQLPAHVGLSCASPAWPGNEKRLDACVTPSLHEESDSLGKRVSHQQSIRRGIIQRLPAESVAFVYLFESMRLHIREHQKALGSLVWLITWLFGEIDAVRLQGFARNSASSEIHIRYRGDGGSCFATTKHRTRTKVPVAARKSCDA